MSETFARNLSMSSIIEGFSAGWLSLSCDHQSARSTSGVQKKAEGRGLVVARGRWLQPAWPHCSLRPASSSGRPSTPQTTPSTDTPTWRPRGRRAPGSPPARPAAPCSHQHAPATGKLLSTNSTSLVYSRSKRNERPEAAEMQRQSHVSVERVVVRRVRELAGVISRGHEVLLEHPLVTLTPGEELGAVPVRNEFAGSFQPSAVLPAMSWRLTEDVRE